MINRAKSNTDSPQDVKTEGEQVQKSNSSGLHYDPLYISKMNISEQTDDDKRFSNSVVDGREQGNVDNIKDLDAKQKSDFVNGEEYSQFSEVLVVAQIRRDYFQSESDPKLLFLIERALFKGVRNILMQAGKIADKEHWLNERTRFVYLRVYYQDINIGYITSTGQQKSTSFIYVHNSVVEYFHGKQILLSFKKEEIKVISYYFPFDEILKDEFGTMTDVISPPPQFKKQLTDQVLECPSIAISDQFKTAATEKNDDNHELAKKQLPLCHQTNWLKQAFIKKHYFKKNFVVLQKTNQDDLKSGISIYFVYRILDDQIYAVKKSRLASSVISFYDMFSTVNLTELTHDQRKIREAKILSKLNHPNVLTLYDWWIEEDEIGYSLYLMSEQCSYPGFKHQTNDLLNYAYYYLNPMPVKEKIESMKKIMLQIMDGLEYIHRRGIVHRDLKPENIFVTVTIHQDLQVILADFDQGKDVRESKMSIISDEKLSELELNSIKSKNTIKSGTSGYQTPNSMINKEYDKCDEFYALGITLLHLILAFPGDPKNRNLYTATFAMSEIDFVTHLFDNWAVKLALNRHKEFTFSAFFNQMELAKKLLEKKVKEHDHIRQVVQSW